MADVFTPYVELKNISIAYPDKTNPRSFNMVTEHVELFHLNLSHLVGWGKVNMFRHTPADFVPTVLKLVDGGRITLGAEQEKVFLAAWDEAVRLGFVYQLKSNTPGE